MQAHKFRVSKDFFGHGSIFKFAKLKLRDSKNVEHEFSDFYPHADIKGIEHAIVCTQDCDIEQKKVTHLNIALLEPIHRPKKENPIQFLDLDLDKLVIPFGAMSFYSVSSLSQLTSRIQALLDNTNAHNMFVEISGEFHFINLTKMYPIKFEHFEAIKGQATFQLSGSFKHLLGWKLANLYGRVGVEIYPPTIRADLTKKILSSVGDSLKSSWPKKSYELTDEQLGDLKELLKAYGAARAKNKDTGNLEKKIYEKLQAYNFVEPIES